MGRFVRTRCRGAFTGCLLLGCTADNPAFDEPVGWGGGEAGATSSSPASTSDEGGASTAGFDGSAGGSGEADGDDDAPVPPVCETPCDEHASCGADGECRCVDGWDGDGRVCARFDAELLRVELPCLSDEDCSGGCPMPDGGSASVELEGDSERSFAVTLGFRGVVERKSYMGGDPDPPFVLGGEPVVDTWNAWALYVSDPAMVIRLNPGTSGDLACVPIEEIRTVVVSGGAKLLLEASTGGDTCGVTNDDGTGAPISFDGMEPFDGQFVEVEILGITPKL